MVRQTLKGEGPHPSSAAQGGIPVPEEIVLDDGPEGTSRARFEWSERTGVRLRFIEPGKPVRDTPLTRA